MDSSIKMQDKDIASLCIQQYSSSNQFERLPNLVPKLAALFEAFSDGSAPFWSASRRNRCNLNWTLSSNWLAVAVSDYEDKPAEDVGIADEDQDSAEGDDAEDADEDSCTKATEPESLDEDEGTVLQPKPAMDVFLLALAEKITQMMSLGTLKYYPPLEGRLSRVTVSKYISVWASRDLGRNHARRFLEAKYLDL